MAVILIVEDNANTRLLTKARLKNEYTILEAEDGEQALAVLDSQHVDLIIADIMMPNMDGNQLVRTIRREGSAIPVIMLTAKSAFEDKRTGFSSGTDDYMTKPIDYEELKWRIKALLRRANIASQQQIRVGDVVLDAASYTIGRGEKREELPRKEFDLLYKLLSYPGMIFTKGQLLDDIWGYDSDSDENTVKTHISRLRGRLSGYPEISIVTLRGLGYKADI